jgi:hypothetical protein
VRKLNLKKNANSPTGNFFSQGINNSEEEKKMKQKVGLKRTRRRLGPKNKPVLVLRDGFSNLFRTLYLV